MDPNANDCIDALTKRLGKFTTYFDTDSVRSRIIADWTQNWLEDNISPEIFTSMEETVSKLPSQESFDNKAVELFTQYLDLRAQAMDEQISKFAE